MSEDRTQPASAHRRQMAREQGMAVHSPELTAAAGWLVAVVLLGYSGHDLAGTLAGLIRGAMTGPIPVAADPASVASQLRSAFFALAIPFSVVACGFAAGAILYTTAQVLRSYRTDQHVAAALALFAAVALLFWYVLRIVMGVSRR